MDFICGRTRVALAQLEEAAASGCGYFYTLALAEVVKSVGADYSDRMIDLERRKRETYTQKCIASEYARLVREHERLMADNQ